MTRQFNRDVVLIIARPRDFSSQLPNATIIRNIRFSFSIEKQLGKEPNKGDLVIYNLAGETRAEFEQRPLHVRLDVGYDGDLQRLFTGDVRYAESMLVETEWETKVQLGDGDRAFRFARVSKSYKSGVTSRQALSELAKAMNLQVPKNTQEFAELDKEFHGGLSLHGQASTELTKILERHNLQWSIQDGRLQILRKGDTRSDRAILISLDEGMIGSPEFGSPPEKGKPPKLTVTTLIRPEIIPGGMIEVRSRNVNGLFKVERVVHSGDIEGDDWMSSIEAVAK